jgi:heat shock protein HslJ
MPTRVGRRTRALCSPSTLVTRFTAGEASFDVRGLMRPTNRLFWIATLCVACGQQVNRAPADTTARPSAAPAGLAGTRWKLVEFIGMNDATKTPTDAERYNVAFGTDGKVSVQADCNRGSGTWSSPEPSSLRFSALATTRAMCPPGSMSDQFLQDFEHMRSWRTNKDGHLFISLMADGGIYEFEPAR